MANEIITTARLSDQELDVYHGGRSAYIAGLQVQLAKVESDLAANNYADPTGVLAEMFRWATGLTERSADERRAACLRGAIMANS